MKRLFGFILIAGTLLWNTSCDPAKGEGDTKKESDCYEFALGVQKGSYKAGKNGVTVNVNSVETDNIVFELVPGESVKSYRMEVYPKALLYNELLNRGLVEAPPLLIVKMLSLTFLHLLHPVLLSTSSMHPRWMISLQRSLTGLIRHITRRLFCRTAII